MIILDAFVKSPSVPLRSGIARLASRTFYAAIFLATFYETIIPDELVKSQSARHCEESAPGGRRGNFMKSMSYKGGDCFALLAMTSFVTFYEAIILTYQKTDFLAA
ncbi:MAG: hypothetical protein NTY64_09775 [Deltaproteobacteria bacterium]|nr:hypothetical protein [Deltaproteobacteria bacterium]